MAGSSLAGSEASHRVSSDRMAESRKSQRRTSSWETRSCSWGCPTTTDGRMWKPKCSRSGPESTLTSSESSTSDSGTRTVPPGSANTVDPRFCGRRRGPRSRPWCSGSTPAFGAGRPGSIPGGRALQLHMTPHTRLIPDGLLARPAGFWVRPSQVRFLLGERTPKGCRRPGKHRQQGDDPPSVRGLSPRQPERADRGCSGADPSAQAPVAVHGGSALPEELLGELMAPWSRRSRTPDSQSGGRRFESGRGRKRRDRRRARRSVHRSGRVAQPAPAGGGATGRSARGRDLALIAQQDRAPVYGTGGRGFDSS